MAEPKTVTLDIRNSPVWKRHPKIFEIIDNLASGDALVLTNDHDPRPLHLQLMVEREYQFEWYSRQKGPREWVATIKRRSLAAAADSFEGQGR